MWDSAGWAARCRRVRTISTRWWSTCSGRCSPARVQPTTWRCWSCDPSAPPTVSNRCFPVEPRQLRILRSRLAGWLDLHGVDPETIFEVSLAVSEAAANAVSHAYGLEDAEFEVQVCWEDDVLVCTVSDHGRWRERPRDSNGRGLMLMRSLADRVDIDASSAGTRVSLRRRVGSRNT